MAEHVESVVTAFARAADRHNDRVAVADPATRLTYDELRRRATRVAHALAAKGVLEGQAVGLRGVSSCETIIAMLGVLMAGAHVVPVDVDYPDERIQQMMSLSGASILLDATPPADRSGRSWSVSELAAREVDPRPLPAADPARTAYVLFTSGSTGAPKGVAVPHGALTALCLRDSPLRRDPDDGVLAHTILTFDPSMLEIWSALLVGASVVCAPRRAVSLHETAALVSDARVTTAVLTPAMFALMVETHLEALGTLRCLIVGGDVMPASHAATVRCELPHLVLLNCYGPTENCIVSTVFQVDGPLADDVGVPIGRPVAGATAYVLDDRLDPVPTGVVGDLWVGGDRLAVAYVGDPGLTAERFRPDPFADLDGARMYRTGDRASVLASGELGFHGREDHEIKIRGCRVDLAEVEALLASDPGVLEVVAVPVGVGHDRSVRAFVRPMDGATTPSEIRARVATRAPSFLVPDEVVLVSSYPLAATGKVDRRALERIEESRSRSEPSELAEPASDGRAVLAAIWLRRTGRPGNAEEDFFSAGGSSLDLVRLIDDVSTELGVNLDFADVYGVDSFDELWEMVCTS